MASFTKIDFKNINIASSFDLTGLSAKNLYWLRRCPLPPWSMCHMWKIWQLAIKNRKMRFCQNFGLSKWLPDKKMALKKAIPERNLALNIAYRTGIWLQSRLSDENLALKGITGREFGSQNHLPDENLAMTWQKCIFLFFIASCQNFYIWHIDQGGNGHLLSE